MLDALNAIVDVNALREADCKLSVPDADSRVLPLTMETLVPVDKYVLGANIDKVVPPRSMLGPIEERLVDISMSRSVN